MSYFKYKNFKSFLEKNEFKTISKDQKTKDDQAAKEKAAKENAIEELNNKMANQYTELLGKAGPQVKKQEDILNNQDFKNKLKSNLDSLFKNNNLSLNKNYLDQIFKMNTKNNRRGRKLIHAYYMELLKDQENDKKIQAQIQKEADKIVTQANANSQKILNQKKDETITKEKTSNVFDVKEGQPVPSLFQGSKEEGWILKLQKFLNIEQDGQFGPNTKKAVMEYQKKNHLNPDGIVGTGTWKTMTGLDLKVQAPDKKEVATKKIDHSDKDSIGKMSNNKQFIIDKLKKIDQLSSVTLTAQEMKILLTESITNNYKMINEEIKFKLTDDNKILAYDTDTNKEIDPGANFTWDFDENGNFKITNEPNEGQLLNHIKNALGENDDKHTSSDIKYDKNKEKEFIKALTLNFNSLELEKMLNSDDLKLEKPKDKYNDVYGFYKYYATETFVNFAEDEWLDFFKNVDGELLYHFIYFYNNITHYYDNEEISFDFFKDSSEGFDITYISGVPLGGKEEMSELSDVLKSHNILINDKEVKKTK